MNFKKKDMFFQIIGYDFLKDGDIFLLITYKKIPADFHKSAGTVCIL